jgi:hypothetical protein
MKLKDLFKVIIETGIEFDFRSKEKIEQELEEKNKQYSELKGKEKEYFDKDKLTNPFSDSKIYNGTGDEEIKTILVGVDVETQELLLLDRLREKGKKIDAAMTHHPEGKGLLDLYEVMYLQSDVMSKMGMPINIAEGIMDSRIKEVQEGLLPANYSRAIDAAVLLGIPFFGAHTPADNCVASYLQKLFDNKKPETLGNVVDLLLEIEEYKISYISGNGPKIVNGAKNKRAGKVFVDMTGGTGGPVEAIKKLVEAGVGTIICMHLGKEHLKSARENHLNVIIAGHMASDTLGLNLLLDQVEKKIGKLEVIGCSGFKRIKR